MVMNCGPGAYQPQSQQMYSTQMQQQQRVVTQQSQGGFQARPLTLMAPQLQVPQLSSMFQGFQSSVGQFQRPQTGYGGYPGYNRQQVSTSNTTGGVTVQQNQIQQQGHQQQVQQQQSGHSNTVSTMTQQHQGVSQQHGNVTVQQHQQPQQTLTQTIKSPMPHHQIHNSQIHQIHTHHQLHQSAAVKMYTAANHTNDSEMKRLRFDQQHPPVVPQEKLNEQSKFDAALASMRREGSVVAIPGGMHIAIGILMGKIVIRGPKSAIEGLKKNPTLSELKDVAWIEEGPTPSEWLVALDFDKTLVKNFLWAELGGLQGASVQKNALQQWVRDGRLKMAFGGDERIARLREVIEARHKKGDFVCILSSGFASVIRLALQHVGLSDILPQDLIYGCDTGPYGISKSSRLTKLKEKYKRPYAALVDDDLNYCRQAHREGHKVIWVRDQAGMESRELGRLASDRWDSQQFLDSQGRIDP